MPLRRIDMNWNFRSRWGGSYRRAVAASTGLLMLSSVVGCGSSYRTPGGPADFRAMGITGDEAELLTDRAITERMNIKPLASFPAAIAVVRVQAPGYYSSTARGVGSGKYTIVTTRDVESEDEFAKLEGLPMVRSIGMLNQLSVSGPCNDSRELRQAAASVQADMVLVYTFDTEFDTQEKVAPLGLITLGLFPDREARVTSTCSAVLMDTRNGFIYGLSEATGKDERFTNAWGSEAAIDSSRRKAEKAAFAALVVKLQELWPGVVSRYGPPGSVDDRG
jgi:hypothetical protein